MAQSPGGAWFEGLIDIVAKRGLTTLAVITGDTLYSTESAQGTIALAKIRERVVAKRLLTFIPCCVYLDFVQMACHEIKEEE